MKIDPTISPENAVVIGLSGPFRLVLPDGRPVALKSLKGQACLALLATAPGFRRSRSWLADKLWSTSAPEQAAGSLRQTLVELRRALGPCEGLLGADRQWVWLDPAGLRIERNGAAEFLEGIDIRDPEWEDWLRNERAADALLPGALPPRTGDPGGAQPAAATGVRLPAGSGTGPTRTFSASIVVDEGCGAAGTFLGGVLAEQLARLISENHGLTVHLDDAAGAAARFHIVPHQGPQLLAVTLSLRRAGGAFLWSGTRTLRPGAVPGIDQPEVAALLFEAQEALVSHSVELHSRLRLPADPVSEVLLAVNDLFSFDAGRMRDAEAALEALSEDAPSPAVLSWLMMAYRSMIFERLAAPTPERIERIAAVTARAMETAPTHSLALANASAMCIRFLGREAEGVELARRAVRLNPSNPFAIDALASARYLMHRHDEGYRLARLARSLAANTRLSQFFDMSLCVAATLAGRHDEAAQHARATVTVSPRFRAGWRYLIAHAAHRGELEEAHHGIARLSAIERDFTAERLAADPDYPAVAIRRAALDLSPLRGGA